MNRMRIMLMSLLFICVAGVFAQQAARKTFPSPHDAVAPMQFAGAWKGTYSSSVVQPTSVTLIFQQRGTTVTGTYLAANGAQGIMYGTASNALAATARQTTPTCSGSFDMQAQVNGNVMKWTFNGTDCLGNEIGTGTATKQ
jgi:hypothetical protein